MVNADFWGNDGNDDFWGEEPQRRSRRDRGAPPAADRAPAPPATERPPPPRPAPRRAAPGRVPAPERTPAPGRPSAPGRAPAPGRNGMGPVAAPGRPGTVPPPRRPGTGPIPASGRPGTGPVPASRRPGTGPVPAQRRPGTGPIPAVRRDGTGPLPVPGSTGTGPISTGRPPGGRKNSSETHVDLPIQEDPPTRRARKKKKKSGRSGLLVTVLAVLILVASLGGGGYFGYQEFQNRFGSPDYSGEGTGSVTIEVAEGEYTSQVGETLVEADVVKSVKAFVQAAGEQLQGLQPGFYDMRKQMSAAAAVTLLLDPKARSGMIDIPPGKWAAEIYAQLSDATGIPVKKFKNVKAGSLGLPKAAEGKIDGYLFPGRYDLPPDATAQELLKMMVARFKKETEDVDFSRGAKVGLTPSEVVTMASLIQAEAGRPGDFRKISRVLHNRLAINMPIQFDTAILYAHQARTLDVRYHHLEIDSPYNLYLHQGLPPGPIGSVSITAIEAAMNPAQGDWIYFVATNPTKRITKFTADEQEFNKFKAEFNQWLEDNPQKKD